MKYLYTAYIWTIGLLLFCIIAMLSLLFLSFIPAKKFSPVFKFLARLLVKSLFIRASVQGFENFNRKESCIVMGNHVSFLDPILLTAFTPYYTIGIEEESHFKWPIYGMLTRKHGNLPINRKSAINSKKTYSVAEQKLREGAHLVIFPEGGRTVDGQLKPFKKLPFLLAKNAACKIIPFGIQGLYQMNNKNSIFINPVKIRIAFGPAITAETVSKLNLAELMEQTQTKILALLEKP